MVVKAGTACYDVPSAVMIGQRLQAHRYSRNLTMQEVQERTGVTPGLLSQYENGKHYPSIVNLLLLCRCYGVNPGEILGGEKQ